MTTALLNQALTAFGAVDLDAAGSEDARSGAGVYKVRTAEGDRGYVKVTPAELGQGAIDSAQRELRFYQEVAPVVPVATPTLLDALSVAEGVALLLSDAGTERPSTAWASEDWSELGRDLAAMHSMPVPAGKWVRPDSLRMALVDPDLDQARAFWAPVLPSLESLLVGREGTIASLDAQQAVFVHGDCHTGNIVRNGRGLAFCDWQSSGLGRAAADLAFLSVRATPAGVTIPTTLVDAYLAARPAADDAMELKRDILAEELSIYIFEWPPYAAYNDSAGIARVQRRARALAEELGTIESAAGGGR